LRLRGLGSGLFLEVKTQFIFLEGGLFSSFAFGLIGFDLVFQFLDFLFDGGQGGLEFSNHATAFFLQFPDLLVAGRQGLFVLGYQLRQLLFGLCQSFGTLRRLLLFLLLLLCQLKELFG